MILNAVAGILAHPNEEQREIAAFKLDGRSTVTADQVVLVAMAHDCIAMTAILGMDAPHETKFRQ